VTQLRFFLDLDGTLADTDALNREAYRRVGVEVPPNAAGLSYREWLGDLVGIGDVERVHTAKQVWYGILLGDVDPHTLALPPTRLARTLLYGDARRSATVSCLTAASHECARTLLRRLGLSVPVKPQLTYDARRVILSRAMSVAKHRGTGSVVYVDDMGSTVERLTEDVPGLRLLHYTGQTYEQLRAELADVLGELITRELKTA